ncbi:MAG: hypothetical protein WCH78_02110 [Bacteroidota bacterium]
MEWRFTIRFDQRNIQLKADMIYQSNQVERIKVTGRNRSIVLQNNRPLLKSKGLKLKRVDWKLIEGEMHNSHVLQTIIQKLEKYLNRFTSN